MATIDDLPNKSILDMDKDELFAHIMTVRSSRRVVKKAVKASPKAPKVKTTDELVGMIPPALAEALLKKLEGR